MAVPKKKMSRSRTRQRKATWKLESPHTNKCPQCGAAKLSHRVCTACGSYKGREAIPS
ncbi:MAG TPA: 50S ribosomal protein L32 [Acidimicrobiia bacterium]|nr:50S ribosomal protein L32 [Acidimicrobiia bacterium]